MDTFPLPSIDDLLDQLGNAKNFFTTDLTAGYWQVQMHPDSHEKTVFITYQGVYKFAVLSFGLKNTPAKCKDAYGFKPRGRTRFCLLRQCLGILKHI